MPCRTPRRRRRTDPEEPEWLRPGQDASPRKGKFDFCAGWISIGRCKWTRITSKSLFVRAIVYRDRPSPADQVSPIAGLRSPGLLRRLRLNRDYVSAYAYRAETAPASGRS